MPATKNTQPQSIAVRSLPIELSQFLKVANVVMSGGEAKSLIQSGLVKVNGVVETRRSRKLAQGDSVDVDGEVLFRVDLNVR